MIVIANRTAFIVHYFSRDRPRVTNATVDLKYLKTLPAGTFGKEYTLFLERLKTVPDERPSVKV